jgi:hypothetical protein
MTTRKLLTILCALTFTLTQSGCGKKTFDGLEKVSEAQGIKGSVNPDFCTLDPSLVNQQLKILFVLDISGSNAITANGRPATDPTRDRRYGSLSRWLDRRAGNPNEYYTLIEFSGDSTITAPDLVNYDPDYAPFTNDKAHFTNVVNTQKNSTSDNGATPYKAALNTVINTIKGDAKKAKERADAGQPAVQSTYVVIFLSDGEPTDSKEPEILTLIESDLMQLPNDPNYGSFITQINLNTGYYYIDVDLPGARKLLKEMAKVGKGEAYSFDTGEIDFDKLTDVIIKKVSTALSDIIVNNLNMVWDMESRSLLADSDADFLSDRMEKTLGSSPFKDDTDENGVRDGVESLLDSKGRPCRDKDCDPLRANAFPGCYKPGTKELLDTDGDGLYDCEELAMNTDHERVDTNGDDLPDYLAVKFSIPAAKEASGTNSPPASSVDTDFDGITNLPEVKINSPPRLDNNTIRNLKPQKYKISMNSYDQKTGVGCYNLSVTDVTYATPEDMIRIYLMENETNQTGRRFFRIIDKRASGFGLTLSPEDFAGLTPKQ